MKKSLTAPGSATPEAAIFDCGLTRHFYRAICCLNLKNHPVNYYIRNQGKNIAFVAQYEDSTHDFELVLKGRYKER